MHRVLSFAFALLALGCGGSGEPVISCDPVGNARPLCGFQNPEDLVSLPGGASLLVSEFGGMMGEHPGAIARLALAGDSGAVLELHEHAARQVVQVLFRGRDIRPHQLR